jgi:nitrite reductase/ring-hydroxylating ferredoxin subunit
LKNDLGSVRLRVTGMPTSFREIIVTRVPGNQFHAVSSECTHEGVTVSAYSASVGGLRCPQHGSLYKTDGTLISGVVAGQRPLTRYNASFDGIKTVSVEIPGLGFVVTFAPVLTTAGTKRVRLEFPTVTQIRYGLRYRSSLSSGDWLQVPFSTTIDGALTVTQLNGNNAKAAVFVQPADPVGFYAVTRF